MADEFTLPELPQLEKNHPEYVPRLEDGFISSLQAYGQQRQIRDEWINAQQDALIEGLKNIVGIEIQLDNSNIESSLEGLIHMQGPSAIKAMRFVRGRQKEINAYANSENIDRLLAAEEAIGDFRKALLDLTEVDLLYKSGSSHEHLYIIQLGLVYEGCAMDGELHLTDSTPDLFTKKKKLAPFITAATVEDISLYKVTNPSHIVPPEEMFFAAIDKLHPLQ